MYTAQKGGRRRGSGERRLHALRYDCLSLPGNVPIGSWDVVGLAGSRKESDSTVAAYLVYTVTNCQRDDTLDISGCQLIICLPANSGRPITQGESSEISAGESELRSIYREIIACWIRRTVPAGIIPCYIIHLHMPDRLLAIRLVLAQLVRYIAFYFFWFVLFVFYHVFLFFFFYLLLLCVYGPKCVWNKDLLLLLLFSTSIWSVVRWWNLNIPDALTMTMTMSMTMTMTMTLCRPKSFVHVCSFVAKILTVK